MKIPLADTDSLLAEVFKEGKAFVSPDASIDPQIKSEAAKLWDIRSLILVPLKAESKVIGVLRIGRYQANCYKKEYLRLAALIANHAAIIIENAQLYDSLRDTKEKLEKLNQIKNEFISIVSHELRTPITAIKGFVKVVLDGEAGNLNVQQKKFLKIADQSVDRLINLITELLDISRIESGKLRVRPEKIDAYDLVLNVLKSISPAAFGKDLKIDMDVPEGLPLVLADSERLFQVFDNLIINSIKFTPSGGKITIFAKEQDDFILFGVKDTGIGISEKDIKKIFEKFYRVDTTFNKAIAGAGLGLSIIKSIIEIHGGQIWVESAPQKGSTFKFTIPKAREGLDAEVINSEDIGGLM
jgi:signal transduction histidine kinase